MTPPPSVASKLVEANHPVAFPPQWLPVLLAMPAVELESPMPPPTPPPPTPPAAPAPLAAICIDGNWPLYATEEESLVVSPVSVSHEHVFAGIAWHMPDGFPGAQHSGECPAHATLVSPSAPPAPPLPPAPLGGYSPPAPLPLKEASKCFEETRLSGLIMEGCEQHFHVEPRIGFKKNLVDGNKYLAYLKSPTLTHVASTNVTRGSRNFQHSTLLTDDAVFLSVRHSYGLGNDGESGLYKFYRSNLSLAYRVIDHVPRYAPVMVGDYVYTTNWGFFDAGARYIIKTHKNNPADSRRVEVGGYFNLMRAGQSIGGVMGSWPSDNSTCGTHLFVSSIAFAYYAPMNVAENTRPVGLDNLPETRGRMACFCSTDMSPCWDAYYFNGKDGGMPNEFPTVLNKHINIARSDYLGTVRQAPCTVAAMSVDNLLPYAFEVGMSRSVAVGDILSTGTRKLKALSSGTTINVTYYGGHHNTPHLGMVLADSVGNVTLTSVNKVYLEHSFAAGVDANLDGPNNNKAYVVPAYFKTVWSISSFADTIDFASDATYASSCIASTTYNAVQVVDANYFYDGQPAAIVDYSGITIKVKYALNSTLPVDARKAVHSAGSNSWTPSTVVDGIIYAPFGNAHYLSADRQLVMQPVLEMQKESERLRVQAIVEDNATAFRAAAATQASIIQLYNQQKVLLSEYDRSFVEDSVHAINATDGSLLWASGIEGTDPWFLAYTASSKFDEYWDSDEASTLITDIWKDVDVNNVYVVGQTVYAWSKGGTLATLDKNTGAVLKVKRYAPGHPAGSSAPANYGGACVLDDGSFAAYATLKVGVSSQLSSTPHVSWIYQDGTRGLTNQSVLYIWNPNTDKETVHIVDVDGTKYAGGISCLKNKVYAYGKFKDKSYITEYGLDGSRKPIAPYQLEPLGITTTVSMNCGGNECFHWEDNSLDKFVVTDSE